jgi:hypothetical protein
LGDKLVNIKILAGFEVRTAPTKRDPGSKGGAPVYFTLHHLAAFGMTQKAGKTTLLEALIVRSNLRAIAFILKRGEGGFHSYNRVPPYFKGRSDWHWLEGLLNVSLQERVKFEPGMRDAIMRAADGSKGDLGQISTKVARLEKEERNSFMRSVYHKLSVYLRDVSSHMSKFQFSDTLDLAQGVNVMDLAPMEEYPEIQQMVIAATLEEIHTHMHDVIGVVPEAWEQLPQGKMTPVKWAAERYVRKGAAIGNYLWIDSQDTGGIDKTPLRQVDNWFFGRMKEAHETDRIAKQLLGVKLPPGEIETLPLGHFITVIGNKVQKIYALPVGVPPNVGQLVATGRMTPEDVQEKYLKAQPPPIVRVTPKKTEPEILRDVLKRLDKIEANEGMEKAKEAQRLRQIIPPEETRTVFPNPDPDNMTVLPETPASPLPPPEPDEPPEPARNEDLQTMEVHEPVQLIAVQDFKGTLTAETTTLMGQIAQLVLEKRVEPEKRMLIKHIKVMLVEEFEGQWGDGEIMQALRNMTAPPYRLFVHEVDNQKRNWFRLRDRAVKQVKQA